MEWKDITSFSRQRNREGPRTLEGEVGDIKIIVTKYVGWGDEWTTCCHPLYDTTALKTTDLEIAKTRALQLFVERVQPYVDAVGIIQAEE